MIFVDELENGKLKNILLKTFEEIHAKARMDNERFRMWTAMNHLLSAAETAKSMDDKLLTLGYDTNPYSNIFGHIADAVYHLIGEEKARFEDSLTYIALNTDSITKDAKVALLFREFEKNKEEPAQ